MFTKIRIIYGILKRKGNKMNYTPRKIKVSFKDLLKPLPARRNLPPLSIDTNFAKKQMEERKIKKLTRV